MLGDSSRCRDGAMLHGTEKQGAIFFIAKHHDRRVKGRTSLIWSIRREASVVVALRARPLGGPAVLHRTIRASH